MAKQSLVTLDYDNGSDIISFDYPTINGQIISSFTNKITVDNFSNWYLLEHQLLMGFTLMQKYDHIIRGKLFNYEIKDEHFLRPEYVSHELYGTTDLWYILLYANNMRSVHEFTKKVIKVFPTSLVRTLGKIMIAEKNYISRKWKPRKLSKHYIKRLNEPSEEVLYQDTTSKSPWMRNTNTSSKLDTLFDGNHELAESYWTDNKDFLRDHLNRKVPRFTLDPDSLTSIPSIFYSTTKFSRTYKGRIKLIGNRRYSLNKYLNGHVGLKIYDDKGRIVADVKGFNHFNEATLIYDFRDAVDTNHIINLRFDDIEGDFVGGPNYKDQPNGEFRRFITFKDSKIARQVLSDLNRINRVDNNSIFANIGFTTNSPDKPLNMVVRFTYEDGRVATTTLLKRADLSMTMGRLAHLKLDIPRHKAKLVDLELLIPKEYTTFNLHSFDLSIKSDQQLILPFKVKKSNWYDMELTYSYETRDRDQKRYFKDDTFEGIYFNPTITEITPNDTIDHGKNVSIQDFKEFIKPVTSKLTNPIELPRNVGQKDTEFSAHLHNFKLPSNYIIEFSLRQPSVAAGGGVGFVLDYKPDNKSGYLFWLAGEHRSPSQRDEIFVNHEGYDILKPGFYELDDIYGKEHYIIEHDYTSNIKVNNYQPLEIPADAVVKVIKIENRLRVFIRRPDGEYVHTAPEVNIEDIEHYHTRGTLGFLTYYSDLEVNIIDYITWDEVTSFDDPEW